jgi:hypothetical protein
LPQNDFSQILMSAVEESLSSLGDSPKRAIFYHLESHFKIKKENIPTNLTDFATALEKLFGPGATYLEQLIAKKLYEKIGLNPEKENCNNFIECVDKFKRHLREEEHGRE